MMRFIDAPLGSRVAMVEAMNDELNNEVRCTYYERREGVAKFSPKFCPAYRLRTIQGTPGDEDGPRFDTGEHRTETELPMTLPVVDAADSLWGGVSG